MDAGTRHPSQHLRGRPRVIVCDNCTGAGKRIEALQVRSLDSPDG